MNLLLLLALAIPLSCLALLVSLALLGVLTLGGVIRLAAGVGGSNIVPPLGDLSRGGQGTDCDA
jgi:hypothetical protein